MNNQTTLRELRDLRRQLRDAGFQARGYQLAPPGGIRRVSIQQQPEVATNGDNANA